MKYPLIFLLIFPFFLMPNESNASLWGFFAHKKINEYAIYSLPQPLQNFYKVHRDEIIERSLGPDRRRYSVPLEGRNHYIDLDSYGIKTVDSLPEKIGTARSRYSEDSLTSHGILPWILDSVFNELEEAFLSESWERVITLSAELGHYLGDAHVPLHTTHNYNGQYSGQHGIHALWESRIPEISFEDWDIWVERAAYINDPWIEFASTIFTSHDKVDSVLKMELQSTREMPNGKFSAEKRGFQLKRNYSKKFCALYESKLDGMIKRSLLSSVQLISSCWYTAWINAGQPNPPTKVSIEEIPKLDVPIVNSSNSRPHEH